MTKQGKELLERARRRRAPDDASPYVQARLDPVRREKLNQLFGRGVYRLASYSAGEMQTWLENAKTMQEFDAELDRLLAVKAKEEKLLKAMPPRKDRTE